MSCEDSSLKTETPAAKPNWLRITSDVFDSGPGTYHGLKAGKLALKWIHTGRHFLNLTEEQAKMFGRGSDMLGSAANATILTKYPFTLDNFQKKSRAYSQLSSTKSTDSPDVVEARDSWIAASADIVGDAAKIGMLVTTNTMLETVSYCSDLVADVSTAKLNHSKVVRLTEDLKAMGEKPATDGSKIRVTEERRHSMLKIAKSVIHTVGVLLGLGILLFALPISSLTMLSISTISLTLAFWAHYYKESMTHVLQEKSIKDLAG